jgi:hypothetical protein
MAILDDLYAMDNVKYLVTEYYNRLYNTPKGDIPAQEQADAQLWGLENLLEKKGYDKKYAKQLVASHDPKSNSTTSVIPGVDISKIDPKTAMYLCGGLVLAVLLFGRKQ